MGQPQTPRVDEAPKDAVEHPWFQTTTEAIELSQADVRGDSLWILWYPRVPAAEKIFVPEPDGFELPLLTPSEKSVDRYRLATICTDRTCLNLLPVTRIDPIYSRSISTVLVVLS